MYLYSFEQANFIYIVQNIADMFYQGIMVVVYKYYEKLYIQLKTVVCYIYYIVKIVNSLVQMILDSIAIGRHIDQVKQYQCYVLSEMTRVVLCKSIPAMLLIILCSN